MPDQTDLKVPDLRAQAQSLENLTAVVVALVSEDGRLLHTNHGCRRILQLIGKNLTQTGDIEEFFIRPTLAELLSIAPNSDLPIYEGIINVGDSRVHCHSLIGAIHRQGNQILMVGEYDVAGMEVLNAQVIELNAQLSTTQRELARNNRKLQASEARLTSLSLSDPLTGLANRRRLMEFLEHEINRFNRYHEPFSVIMADIDYFKKVNDEFGHDMGDKVLQGFSKLMQANMRDVDLVARLGGEEFVIVMQKTSLNEATEKAQTLRTSTKQLSFEGMQRGITTSFGVAEFTSVDDAHTLLKRVDQAVYASKNSGRDCVTAHDTAHPPISR